MTNVVITGSSRGLGFALAREFLQSGANVIVSARDLSRLQAAVDSLQGEFRLLDSGHADGWLVRLTNSTQTEDVHANEDGNLPIRIRGVPCDVRVKSDLEQLWQTAMNQWDKVDIWINNAGVNQYGSTLWELSEEQVELVIQTNLMGTLYGTQVAMNGMLAQGIGYIYNVEGFGSNDMFRKGLNLYGTSKRAMTHMTRAFAKEAKDTPVRIGLLSPGMMVTDFVTSVEGHTFSKDQTEKIFNILGDRPETVARFLVARMLRNPTNGTRIAWLTKGKVLYRFARSMVKKRDLFH